MSHFIKIQTEIRERERLLDALRDLGVDVETGDGLLVRGDQRREERAEVVVRAAIGVDIGFRRVGETYEVVADWYRVEQQSQLRRERFLADLTQRYARGIVLDQAKEQNLIVEEERLSNGDIVLVLSERG